MTAARFISLLVISLILAGCVTRHRNCAADPAAAYPGRDRGIAALECRASSGDHTAQLELGVALEAGTVVQQDLPRAAKLYATAAAFTSGTLFFWSPPVGKSPGQIVPVRAGSDQAGLPMASYRLALLKLSGRGTAQDVDGAKRLLKQAADQGVEEARAKMGEL